MDETLRLRNLGDASKALATDILNIHYKDTARMLTYGVLFCDDTEKGKLRSCRFDDFLFARGNEFLLKVPALTRRERHILDKCLPSPTELAELHPWLRDDFQEYKDLYRYYPNFEEVER